jgi:putative transposase
MLGVAPVCEALGVPRASYYRHVQPPVLLAPRPSPPRSLSSLERQEILDLLNSERFVDLAPAEVFAILLDEKDYRCSIRTMYRILEDSQLVRERRKVIQHPKYKKPELLATGPNQVWSWDITKLLGPKKWTCYYLYVVMDIFSRKAVGWMVAESECSALAKILIQQCVTSEKTKEDTLTIHSDRGAVMTSKPVAGLMGSLGITKSHSRPYTSNDNPFSESLFKTLKYRPPIPERFEDKAHAIRVFEPLFDWYNNDHRHESLGLHTPHDVHHGLAFAKQAERARTMQAAYELHPERFPKGRPTPPSLPTEVWINPPETKAPSQ